MLGKFSHVLPAKWLRAHVGWLLIQLPRPADLSNVVGARPPLCGSLSPESLYVLDRLDLLHARDACMRWYYNWVARAICWLHCARIGVVY